MSSAWQRMADRMTAEDRNVRLRPAVDSNWRPLAMGVLFHEGRVFVSTWGIGIAKDIARSYFEILGPLADGRDEPGLHRIILLSRAFDG